MEMKIFPLFFRQLQVTDVDGNLSIFKQPFYIEKMGEESIF